MLVTARMPPLQSPEPLKYPSQLLKEIVFVPSTTNRPQVFVVPPSTTRNEQPATLDQALVAATTSFSTCEGALSVLTLNTTDSPVSASNHRSRGFHK